MKRMSTVFAVFLWSLANAGCPSGYTLCYGTFCIRKLQSNGDFCKASQACYEHGLSSGHVSFLSGRNIVNITNCETLDYRVWSSLTSFFGTTKLAEFGWNDADPRDPEKTFFNENFAWGAYQPEEEEYNLIYYVPTGKMHDFPLNVDWDKLTVICEYAGKLPAISYDQLFRANYPTKYPSFIQQRKKQIACNLTVHANSQLECAFK